MLYEHHHCVPYLCQEILCVHPKDTYYLSYMYNYISKIHRYRHSYRYTYVFYVYLMLLYCIAVLYYVVLYKYYIVVHWIVSYCFTFYFSWFIEIVFHYTIFRCLVHYIMIKYCTILSYQLLLCSSLLYFIGFMCITLYINKLVYMMLVCISSCYISL
jgi:hypothetical protein